MRHLLFPWRDVADGVYAPPLKPLELVLVRLDFRRVVADGAYAPPLQPLELFLVRLDFSSNNERVRSLSLRILEVPSFLS